MSSRDESQPAPTSNENEGKTKIAFLLSYADPATSFSDLKRLPANNDSGFATPPTQWAWPLSDMSFPEALCCSFETPVAGHPEEIEQLEIMSYLQNPEPIDSLQERIDDILGDLESHVAAARQQLDGTRLELSALTSAHEYINPSDLRMAVGAFFKYIHHNCPVVHQPSFNMHKISTVLLLSIFASGHTVLRPHLSSIPPELLALFEDFIFQQICLDIYDKECTADLDPREIEAFQAATIFTSMLVATNNPTVQQRLRERRFPALLNALRYHSVFKSRTTWQVDDPSMFFNWKRFIDEELIARLAFMAFLFDAQSVIFFRAPNQLTIQEMTADLPSPDTVFMAESSDTCRTLLDNLPTARPPCLASLIRILLDDSSIDLKQNGLENLTLRGLFMLILALNHVIFVAQASCTITHIFKAVDLALERWKDLWDYLSEKSSEEEMDQAGFMKFAPHFWSLAKVLICPAKAGPPLDRVNLWSRDYMYRYFLQAAGQCR